MPLFEIDRVRSLHSQAQLEYLWKISVIPAKDDPLTWQWALLNVPLLATQVSFPGVDVEIVPFQAGGVERYTLGKIKRGGPVSISFIETESSIVEDFFRQWLHHADFDPMLPFSLLKSQYHSKIRQPRQEYARDMKVKLYARNNTANQTYTLRDVLPQKIGPYEKTYDRSGPMIIPIGFVCDEVTTEDTLFPPKALVL